MKSCRRLLFAAWLVLAVGASAQHGETGGETHDLLFPKAQARPFAGHPALTPEQRTAYANRAKFFRRIRPEYRPDLDWRTALSKSLDDVDPEWSQGFEELIIRDFFGDREGGFYVDVGCYLPRKGSTTYDLEQRLKWAGVGIDVIGRYGEAWKRLRPRSTFVQAAVADTDGETVQLHLAGPFATLDEKLLKDFGRAKRAKVIEVKTATLNTLLEKQGVEKFDFLSMDIEGAELAALKGFDIKRFQPGLCCIETAHRDAVVGYFESNGYEWLEKYLKADKINLYFRPKPEK